MTYKYRVIIESDTPFDEDEVAEAIEEMLDGIVSCKGVTDESDDN